MNNQCFLPSVKPGNYWRWLKKKLNPDGVQLVSVTHDFKFEAPDGKKRAADVLDYDGVVLLANMKGIDYSYYYEQED